MGAEDVYDAPEDDELEVSWLRALSQGATVPQIAAQAGCTERDVYQRLNGLYVRLGVRSRSEAIKRVVDPDAL